MLNLLLLSKAFSSCSACRLLFVAVHRLLTAVTSLVEEPGLRGMQNLPRLEIELVSSALGGGFLMIGLPSKSNLDYLNQFSSLYTEIQFS